MVATDCQSKVCTAGACAVPSCTDGVQNGNETSPDCGGGCMCGGPLACDPMQAASCPAGTSCMVDPMTGVPTCVGTAQSCNAAQAAACPAGSSCSIDPASGNAVCSASAQWSCVKINEVTTGTTTTATDEYVELYNTCAANVDISGGTLVYRSAAGTSDVVFVTFAPGTVMVGGTFQLYAGSGYAGMSNGVYASAGMAQLGGGLQLRDPMGTPVDSVGWGSATNAFIEGTVVAAPAQGASIGRSPNGLDTNDNNADFKQQLRTPFMANP
jgi:hypothetical protein